MVSTPQWRLLVPSLAIPPCVCRACHARSFLHSITPPNHRVQIQKSLRDVQVMVQQVGEARTWAQSNLAVYQHKSSEAQAAVRGHGMKRWRFSSVVLAGASMACLLCLEQWAPPQTAAACLPMLLGGGQAWGARVVPDRGAAGCAGMSCLLARASMASAAGTQQAKPSVGHRSMQRRCGSPAHLWDYWRLELARLCVMAHGRCLHAFAAL